MKRGERIVRECLKIHGWKFRDNPKEQLGLQWCRRCGYQVLAHERVIRADSEQRAPR